MTPRPGRAPGDVLPERTRHGQDRVSRPARRSFRGTLLFFSRSSRPGNNCCGLRRSGRAAIPQDGWDVWGMLIALVVVAVMSLVVVVHATDVEVSDDVPWEQVVFGLALGLCGLTLLKNLTDADSDVGQLPRAWGWRRRGRGRLPGLVARARLGASGEPLEQEHAVIAQGRRSPRRPDRPRSRAPRGMRPSPSFAGDVTQRTRTSARVPPRRSARRASGRSLSSPRRRHADEMDVRLLRIRLGEEPDTKPASSPSSSSATNSCPRRGRTAAAESAPSPRPPHHTLTRPITRP